MCGQLELPHSMLVFRVAGFLTWWLTSPRTRMSKLPGFLPGSGSLQLLILSSESPFFFFNNKDSCLCLSSFISLLLPFRKLKAQRPLFMVNCLCPFSSSQCNSFQNLVGFLCIKLYSTFSHFFETGPSLPQAVRQGRRTASLRFLGNILTTCGSL